MLVSLMLLLLGAAPAFADDLKCGSGDPLALDFNTQEGIDACNGTPSQQCANTVQELIKANNELQRLRQTSCGNLNTIMNDQAEASTQRDSTKKVSQLLGQAVNDSGEYLTALKQRYSQIKLTLKDRAGPLALPRATPGAAVATAPDKDTQEKQAILNSLDSAEKMKRLGKLSPAARLSEITTDVGRSDPGLFAAVNAVNYLKKILKEEETTQKAYDQMKANKDIADGNSQRLDTRNDTPDKTKPTSSTVSESGSGLDMKTVMGLASAGMALAPLLQKKDAANNAADASSTSPTPGSTNEVAAAGPKSSKLGDDEKATSQVPVAAEPKKDSAATPSRVPSGSSYHDSSDVSKGGGAFAGSGTGSSSAAPARSGGGSGGSGGAGTSSDSAEPAAAAAKNQNPPSGEETQGIGGGALGGGGPPSLGGAPVAPGGGDPAAAATPEDTMKDLLHEMKETAEGTNTPNLQASAADITMTDEDLFPRVRAAHVRALKQGRILDSLAEKITEDNQ